MKNPVLRESCSGVITRQARFWGLLWMRLGLGNQYLHNGLEFVLTRVSVTPVRGVWGVFSGVLG